MEFFEKITGLATIETGFHPWGDHAGGSPDRLIGEDAGLEVKCPWQSENQVDYMMLTDFYDLKNMYPDHYWQCVSLLLFTDRKRWHFCTFDPRMKSDLHKMTFIDIHAEKVKDDMDLINTVIATAVKLKLELLNLLTKSIPELKAELNP